MQIVSVKKRLSVPADKVWSILSQGGGVDRWFPIIASCELDGSGPGATRVCTTVQGQRLEETIEVVDHANRIFQYRIDRQEMMPTTSVRGTMHVSDDGAGHADVLWFLNYALADATAADAVRAGIGEMYAAGLAGLERLAREAS